MEAFVCSIDALEIRQIANLWQRIALLFTTCPVKLKTAILLHRRSFFSLLYPSPFIILPLTFYSLPIHLVFFLSFIPPFYLLIFSSSLFPSRSSCPRILLTHTFCPSAIPSLIFLPIFLKVCFPLQLQFPIFLFLFPYFHFLLTILCLVAFLFPSLNSHSA